MYERSGSLHRVCVIRPFHSWKVWRERSQLYCRPLRRSAALSLSLSLSLGRLLSAISRLKEDHAWQRHQLWVIHCSVVCRASTFLSFFRPSCVYVFVLLYVLSDNRLGLKMPNLRECVFGAHMSYICLVFDAVLLLSLPSTEGQTEQPTEIHRPTHTHTHTHTQTHTHTELNVLSRGNRMSCILTMRLFPFLLCCLIHRDESFYITVSVFISQYSHCCLNSAKNQITIL